MKLLQQDEHSLVVTCPSDPSFVPPHTCRVHQTVHHVSDSDVASQLTTYWSQYWLRDPVYSVKDELLPLREDPTGQFLWNVLPTIGWDRWTCPHTVEAWLEAIHQIKTRSAPGIDGITFKELRAIPSICISWLIDIITRSGPFPDWMMLARTVPLAKKEGDLRVSDSRPITILASIYRVWSKVTCHALVSHISAFLPRHITGLLPKRGAFQAIYKQQWALEHAKQRGISLQGITLDLTKCFNTLRRTRLLQQMRDLNFPAELVECWYFSLQSLSRYWDIGGFASDTVGSTTGCPEGDAFSVLTMLLVCLAWTSLVTHDDTDIEASAYADNWSMRGPFHTHEQALRDTLRLCDFLGLSIDWSKTWLWSTDGNHIDDLRSLVQHITGCSSVAVKLRATDLGCEVAYKSHAVFGRMIDRFDRARARLVRLQRQRWRHDLKLRLIRSSVYQAAFYGVELVLAPTSQLTSLRTQVAYALLGGSCKTVNAAILLYVIPSLDDPFVYVIVQALKQAKAFMHTHPASQHDFVRILAIPDNRSKVHGPASALREYLGRVGLGVDKRGFLFGGPSDGLHLVDSPLRDLVQEVTTEWQQHLLLFNTERTGIGMQLRIDGIGTGRLLSEFSDDQRLLLLREISGGFQTQLQKSKWDVHTSDQCQWCNGAQDTRAHRIFSCPAFAQVRLPHEDLLSRIQEDFEFLANLPTLRVQGQHALVRLMSSVFPEPELAPAQCDQILGLYGEATPVFYTDGSCAYPDQPVIRFASYSVIADLAVTEVRRQHLAAQFKQTSRLPDTLVPIAVARLSGRQVIHRAELVAVLWIFAHFDRALVHSDSSFVLLWVEKLQAGYWDTDVFMHDDYDLLKRLKAVLRPAHQVLKVKAHQDCHLVVDHSQCYRALGNHVADLYAGKTNRDLLPEAAQVLHDYAAQYLEQMSDMRAFYSYLVQFNYARIQAGGSTQDGSSQDAPPVHNLLAQMNDWHADGDWTCPAQVCEDWLSASCWGIQLMWVMHSFLRSCQWPSDEQQQSAVGALGFSWVEMAVAIALEYGQWLPVKRKRSDQLEYLFQPTTAEEVSHAGYSLGEQAWVVSQIFTHYTSLVPVSVTPTLT
eukprot:Skav207840  [mRNA]  locus=scaffold3025:85744:89028:+ [translate_table: standard]